MFKTLIVEDHATFRQSLRLVLNARFPFMSFAEADTGRQAMKQVRNFAPDLVFMDINLPDENGLALTRAIKADHAGTTVIIVTAYDLPEYRAAAIEAGASRFIPKGSLGEEEVLNLVQSVIDERVSR